ncbi:MAG: hypothetical protein WCE73_07020 [Candidatus Angelobacter sp.]
MKYICMGDLEPGKFEGMTEDGDETTRHVEVAKRTFTRKLPEAVWWGERSSGSFDFALIPALRDSRGAQDDRVGNFRQN